MPPRSSPRPPAAWRNRVQELRYVAPRDLADHPLQWRTHPDHQRAALRGVLQEIGIAGALLAYESPTTGLTSIDGHLRKSLDPDTPWPTLVLDVDDAEAALLLATHDPLAALAEADRVQLEALLHEVTTGDAAVQQLLSDLAAHQGLIPPDNPLDHWQGMPAFEQESQQAFRTIYVHFLSQAAVEAFGQLLQQPITDKTKYLYFPAQERADFTSLAYVT
jgi:hypothetical protein